jgi:hypothetical protein
MSSKTLVAIGSMICMMSFLGCSTPYDLKKTEPIDSYLSTKSVDEVKRCIFNKWRGHHPNVSTEETSNGWLVRYDDTPGATEAMVVVEGNVPQVQVDYFTRSEKIKLHRLEDELKSCI